ncbi:hypothetical protein KQI61_17505, partial [Anaerocolumna aminovalerica]|uniref:hypothetical protein n=1 Tax=Anaerocolumna aminovalerica TaxID=1527 RepID=UPI001C0F0FCD|nr:hypothetical protein [Anaerocolumna aminovalerica]
MVVSRQLNYTKTRWFHAIFMPVIIEFPRCIGTYLSAKFELYYSYKQNKGSQKTSLQAVDILYVDGFFRLEWNWRKPRGF